MKGLVFTELLALVEEKFGLEVLDQLLEQSELSTQGVYTAVGTYPFSDMQELVTRLSAITGLETADLLKSFGWHMFQVFVTQYPQFFAGIEHPFALLEQIDRHIHVEVKKLYPDAELPRFSTKTENGEMELIYRSNRRMADLAQGLIEAAFVHYGIKAKMERENLQADGTEVRFFLKEE